MRLQREHYGSRAPHRRHQQSGAVLLVVLILTTVFAAVSVSLLATTESSIRAHQNGLLMERAERAAQSGVEWAAAHIEAFGESAGTTVVPLDVNLEARVQIIPGATPNAVSEGRCSGVSVTVLANVKETPDPWKYLLASFYGKNEVTEHWSIGGSIYSGDPSDAFQNSANPALTIDGDLDRVDTATFPSGQFTCVNGGQDNPGFAPMPEPAWDTASFLSLTSGAVNVYHYTCTGGQLRIEYQTLDGIVVVDASGGGILTLEETTINGTLVVHVPNPEATSNLGDIAAVKAKLFKLSMYGDVVINGGTAWTGNLAILAPGARLHMPLIGGPVTLTGTVSIGGGESIRRLTLDGALLSRGPYKLRNQLSLSRAPGWAPDLPMGLTLPGSSSSLSIEWIGRQ